MPVRLNPRATPPGQTQPSSADASQAPNTAATSAAPAAPAASQPAGHGPATSARWTAFSGDSPAPQVRIAAFGSPLQNAAGRVQFEWEKPGDKIPFELTVEVHGDASQLKAQVWTNANHNDAPEKYEPVEMVPVRQSGSRVTYRAELPIDKVGNYRASGRVSVDGGTTWRWMSESGIPDVRFRARAEQHDALNMEEVNVLNLNHDRTTHLPGTFADMMQSGSPTTNGKYTLEWIASQGKNAIWLMPPFEISKWEHRHPLDDAGSPYAVKDYFSVRTEMARSARGLQGEKARAAAIQEFKAFVEKAHSLGIKVIVDVALNHVGHNYEFRDLFVRYTQAGKEIREVRKNDFANVVVNPEQLKAVKLRLADSNVPKYMEYIAPWMYGSKFLDPHGAQNAADKIPGGWGLWYDVAQLNHGRIRSDHGWGDVVPYTPENRAVQGWLERVLRFWAVDLGVDGFRLDHFSGLPSQILDETLNKVQADVDKHQPGKVLYFTGEAYHFVDEAAPHLDSVQGGWFNEFYKARTPGDFQNIVDSPYFSDLVNLDSHDEIRPAWHFRDDPSAALRLGTLLRLFGGPTADVVGDDFFEKWNLGFKQYREVDAVRDPSDFGRFMADRFGRVGRARQALPSLQDDNRWFLQPRTGGPDSALLAMSRWPDLPHEGNPVLVFANLDNSSPRENAFSLNEELRKRIEPDKRYQVRDLLGDDPQAPLWKEPLTGRELLEKGVFARLGPYQVQVLELTELP